MRGERILGLKCEAETESERGSRYTFKSMYVHSWVGYRRIPKLRTEPDHVEPNNPFYKPNRSVNKNRENLQDRRLLLGAPSKIAGAPIISMKYPKYPQF